MRWMAYENKLLAALFTTLLFFILILLAWFYSVYNLYVIWHLHPVCISKPLESPQFTVSHIGKDKYAVKDVKTGRIFIATGTD